MGLQKGNKWEVNNGSRWLLVRRHRKTNDVSQWRSEPEHWNSTQSTRKNSKIHIKHKHSSIYLNVQTIQLGLAVLSMCGNLAAGELKGIFMKIHYFGRKISWRRRMKKQEQSVSFSTKYISILLLNEPVKGEPLTVCKTNHIRYWIYISLNQNIRNACNAFKKI